MHKISIVIPAYNEEKYLKKTVLSFVKSFPKEEIIIVPNGCTDKTPEIAVNLSKKFSNVKNFIIKEKVGKGAAVVYGLRKSSGYIIGFVDADGSYKPKHVKKLIDSFEKKTLVCGSKRFDKDEYIIRKITSFGWNFLARILFGIKMKDTQAGAKIMDRKVFDSIKKFTSKGFAFDVELIFKAKKNGFKIKEIPLKISHKNKKLFIFLLIPNMFIELMKLRLSI
ncbi:MAG: glycosyltransferase family 2 protein [Candidatus Aenigmarchaeota archaeon]|nr:glycosyltransferase family 2 protein [Candidatus Aenigmarchaeota archaeon]